MLLVCGEKKDFSKKKRLHQHRRTGSSRSYDFCCRWIWVLCIPTAKYNLTRFNLQAGHMALSGFCDTILRQWQLLTIYNEHLSNKIRRWEIEMQLTLCSFEMYLRCTWTDIACSLCHFISFINIGRNKSRVSIALDCMGTANEQINIRLEGEKKMEGYTNLSVRRIRHRSCCSNLRSFDWFWVNTSLRLLVELDEIHRPWLNCWLARAIWRTQFGADAVNLVSRENIANSYSVAIWSSESALLSGFLLMTRKRSEIGPCCSGSINTAIKFSCVQIAGAAELIAVYLSSPKQCLPSRYLLCY